MLSEYLKKWEDSGNIRTGVLAEGDIVVIHIQTLNYNVDSVRFAYLMDHIRVRSGGTLTARTNFHDFKNGLLILHVDCHSFYYDESKVTESMRMFLEVLLPSLEY